MPADDAAQLHCNSFNQKLIVRVLPVTRLIKQRQRIVEKNNHNMNDIASDETYVTVSEKGRLHNIDGRRGSSSGPSDPSKPCVSSASRRLECHDFPACQHVMSF